MIRPVYDTKNMQYLRLDNKRTGKHGKGAQFTITIPVKT